MCLYKKVLNSKLLNWCQLKVGYCLCYQQPLSITNSEIKFIYEEPMEVSQVIQSHISSMHFPEEKAFKSLAIMSCGNDNFGSQVESESQKYRWVKDAPNIYFYNESYET